MKHLLKLQIQKRPAGGFRSPSSPPPKKMSFLCTCIWMLNYLVYLVSAGRKQMTHLNRVIEGNWVAAELINKGIGRVKRNPREIMTDPAASNHNKLLTNSH